MSLIIFHENDNEFTEKFGNWLENTKNVLESICYKALLEINSYLCNNSL